MKCPRCDGKLKVTHTYNTPTSKMQRLICGRCLAVVTAETVILEVNPPRGKGASTLAKLRGQKKA